MGWELRQRRQRAGLTLRQVARAAGTSETNLSAYERGAKRPGERTLRRLLAAIDAGSDSPVHAHRLMTAPATAASLRAALKQGWLTQDLLRLVREMRANARHLRTRSDFEAFFSEPSTTGDQRWDAMLAGSVEDLAMRIGHAPPTWTAGHALPTFWFVGPFRGLDAYAFGYSPFSLRIRGVMIDPASLESA